MSDLRIGFFSALNYLDKNAFSGSLYYMHKSLTARKDIKVINLGMPRRYFQWRKYLNYAAKVGFVRLHDPLMAEYNKFIRVVTRQLNSTPCDLILAAAASKELNFLSTDLPVVFVSDATPKLLNDTYKIYLSEEDYISASQLEMGTMSRASKIVYSSEWAANSANYDYHADSNKIEVVPFGANLDTIPPADVLFKKCSNTRCRLLFIGKEWQRKGGIIAYQTLLHLLNRGVDAELVMVGTVTPPDIQHEKLTVIPFLNKNRPQDYKKFSQLLLETHFLILPTRADCTPVVIGEANAYGVPAIATDVGGIPTMIRNGYNGYVLPLSALADDYADLIANTFSDKDNYKQLVRFSRLEYDTRLNWDKWAERLHQIMVKTLETETLETETLETEPTTKREKVSV